MKKCTYCGKEHPDEALVCAIDGEPLQSDAPAPEPEVVEAKSAVAPIQADVGFEVLDGFRYLGGFGPLNAVRLLRRFETAGIRFLTKRTEEPENAGRSISKLGLILIYVHQNDEQEARTMGVRPSVAFMEVELARYLYEYLKRNLIGVAFEITKDDDSGIEMGEVSVDDRVFDQACNMVEAWGVIWHAAQKRLERMPCPKCRSRRIGLVLRDTEGYTFRCKDCGCDYDS